VPIPVSSGSADDAEYVSGIYPAPEPEDRHAGGQIRLGAIPGFVEAEVEYRPHPLSVSRTPGNFEPAGLAC
jgi:hypothetical protein